MKMQKKVFLPLLVLALVLCMQKSVCATEPYEKIANANEWKVLKIVNRERIAQGLEPVSLFRAIQKAAGVRAEEISYCFSHTRPDGTSCFSAVHEEGIDYMCAGENIAAGYTSPRHVMEGWMNSPGHRGNILSGGYDHIGVGYCTGGSYGKNWVQIFVGGCSLKKVKANDVGTANYPIGTTIDQMNRYLIVRCDDHGVGYVPVIEEMCSGYDPSRAGSQTIKVSYCGKTVKIPVTIGTKAPAKVKNLKAQKVTKTAVTLKWSKRSGKGYEIWVKHKKSGKYEKVKTLTSANKTSYKVKKLQSGEKYYFKVRAYKKVNNKKIYGPFSKAVVVKTK